MSTSNNQVMNHSASDVSHPGTVEGGRALVFVPLATDEDSSINLAMPTSNFPLHDPSANSKSLRNSGEHDKTPAGDLVPISRNLATPDSVSTKGNI